MQKPETGPWYQDGLQFTCTQCGDCCTGSAGFVWVDEAEIGAIAEHLNKPIGEVRLLHTRPARGRVSLMEYANGDCIYLDPQSRRCRIYPVRPRQCRTWPFWRSNLASHETWEQTRQKCPGIGCGELVSLAQIEQRVSEIDL
jgi:Fe-S-cluster containining protein